MDRWLKSALDYIPRWIEFQMRMSQQPGCVIAISHNGRIVLEQAWGSADLARGAPLTPRHRFRAASHSKSFTAAGILKLRERGRLKLDDPVGQYVGGLHPKVAAATIAQVLSHSAGLIRDGADSTQFLDRRPFLDADELKADLKAPPVIEASVEPSLIQYAVRLASATRDPERFGVKDMGKYLSYGASPRASIHLIEAARALAFLRGRDYALPEDVVDLVPDVFRHRLVLSYEALAEGLAPDEILKRLMKHIRAPEKPLQHVASPAARV